MLSLLLKAPDYRAYENSKDLSRLYTPSLNTPVHLNTVLMIYLFIAVESPIILAQALLEAVVRKINRSVDPNHS